MLKKIAVLTVVSLFSALSFGAGALNWYASAETEKEIAASEITTVISFDDAGKLDKVKGSGDITAVEQIKLPDNIDNGANGIKVSFVDTKDGKAGGRQSIILPIDEPIDLSGSRALVFNYHVSERLSNYFLGRYDVRTIINNSKMQWTIPAVKPNWHSFIFDFDESETIPEKMTDFKIIFGDLLAGYETGEITLGPIKLVSLPELSADDNIGEILEKDKSWARRYVAIKSLADNSDTESLKLALAAAGDTSVLIRNFAVDVMAKIASKNPEGSAVVLKDGMANPSWRVRVACIKLIDKMKEHYGWADEFMWKGLMDDCFYVREFCLKQITNDGMTDVDVAKKLASNLDSGDKGQAISTLRMIGEIGPIAKETAPVMMGIVRDSFSPTELRYWALSTVWWLDEDLLEPKDWVLALSLDPGEVHRHLLNKSMERLIAAGQEAVPALLKALKAPNPQLRCRVTAILKQMGPEAKGATKALKRIIKKDKWYIAYEADQALRAIDPRYKGRTITPPYQQRSSKLSLDDNGTTTTVSNGIIEMVFVNGNDEGGPDIVRRVGGGNLVDGDWIYGTLAFKYSKGASILERRWFQKLWGSPVPKEKEDVETKVFYQDDNIIDYMFKYSRDGFDMEYEYHYVLQKNRSGYYFYAVTRNVSGEFLNDGTSFSGKGTGRMAQLTAVTWDAYDYAMIHDNLKRKATFAPSVTTFYTEYYPDIYQCTFRMPDGELAVKHEWAVHQLKGDVYGFAGLKNGGFWCIPGSLESKAAAWPRNETGGINNNLFLTNVEGKYYINNCAPIIDENWEKVTGPFFFYINDGENIEEMWTDAKRQAAVERQEWPYKWLTSCGFQDRGTVKGKLKIEGDDTEGAYVILSSPINQDDPDQVSLWMRNTNPYIYWRQLDEDGSYEIKNVRSGSYGVYAFKPGIFGETYAGKITVENGKVAKAPDMLIQQQSEGKLIWQIGTPDGGAEEFKNGNNYHMWNNCLRYAGDFPNDVHYTVGKSDWSKDWNYMQPGTPRVEGGGENKLTTWTIDFDLDELPANKGVLTIMCGGRSVKTQIFVNDKKVGNLNVNIGTQHIRSVPYGQQVLKKYEIDRDILTKGKNTIEITYDLNRKDGDKAKKVIARRTNPGWICYDFLRFEVQ